MKLIIKIILLFFLIIALFTGIRIFPGDLDFNIVLDQWLDQFQERETETSNQQEDIDDNKSAISRVEIHKGLLAVRLTKDIMDRSGIQTSSLQVVTHLNEARATGSVIDFKPLLRRQAEYQKAESELTMAEENLHASVAVYERLRVLHKERANVSLQQVENARLRMAEDRARTVAARQNVQNIRSETLQEWGNELTTWALGSESVDKNESSYFDRLLEKQEVLILVTLAPDLVISEDTSFIYVNTRPDRSTARKAYLISPAAYTNPIVQGVTYYFRTAAENMRIGMRLTAWVVLSDEVETGIDVPLSSVIWYGGQPWVYVQVDDDLYSRRPVSEYRETDYGWFIKDVFSQDEKIVIRGGQLLLSEELRWQIPDEDDD